MTKATLFVAPNEKAGERHSIVITDDEGEKHWMIGFSSFHDAWVFCVTNLMIDPLCSVCDKKFTLTPPKQSMIQRKLM